MNEGAANNPGPLVTIHKRRNLPGGKVEAQLSLWGEQEAARASTGADSGNPCPLWRCSGAGRPDGT